MPLVHHLYQLQQLDRELEAVQQALLRLEERLSRAPEVDAARRKLDEARERHRTQQRRFQDAEHKANVLRRKIREIEAQLAGGRVRNPRQVQVLQDELTYLRRKLDEAEEAAIHILMALEEAQAAVAEAQEELNETTTRRSQQEETWLQERARLLRRQQDLMARREALVDQIPQEAMSLYEDLRARKGRLAVARVQEGACEACGALLSATRRQEAAHLEVITLCPQCGRILYAP